MLWHRFYCATVSRQCLTPSSNAKASSTAFTRSQKPYLFNHWQRWLKVHQYRQQLQLNQELFTQVLPGLQTDLVFTELFHAGNAGMTRRM